MRPRFGYDIPVRFADTDAQGHVFFANYLTYCDEGLTAYMREIGCAWQDLIAVGVDAYYVSATCDYKGRATFGTTLTVHTRIAEFGYSSMVSEYALASGDEVIATAKLTSVCVDRNTGQPLRVPDRLREAVARYEAAG